MYEANKALSYFVTHNWEFKNDNCYNLCSYLRLEDLKEFEYRDGFTYDVVLSIRTLVLGFRRYLLKEKDETLPKSREMFKRMEIATDVFRYIFYMFAIYLTFFHYNVIKTVKGFF